MRDDQALRHRSPGDRLVGIHIAAGPRLRRLAGCAVTGMDPQADPSFTVAEDAAAGVSVIAAAGEIDIAVWEAFDAALDEATAVAPAVVVDLTACSFMDSSNLACLVAAQRRATAAAIPMAVACVEQGVPRRLIELAAPGRFDVHATVAEATAACAAARRAPGDSAIATGT